MSPTRVKRGVSAKRVRDPRMCLGGLRLEILAPSDVARLFDAVLCTVRRAIEAEAGHLPPESEAFEAMLDYALGCWGVEDYWLRRRLSKRHYAVFDRDD